MYLFIDKFVSLQSLFGKEADKLEQANDDDKTCILLYKTLGIFKLVMASCNSCSLK